MRTMTLLTLVAGTIATPLAAQDHRLNYSSGDTVVTIRRTGDDDQCTVKIGTRELSQSDAKAICERIVTRNLTNSRLLELQAGRLREQSALFSDQAAAVSQRLRSFDTLRTGQMRALEQQARIQAGEAANLSRALELQARSRDRSGTEARRLLELAQRDRNMFTAVMPTMVNRAIIGVNIDPRARDTDRWGAYVAAVTPNGPADRAGLRAGDVITKVDGQSMTSREGVTADEGESLPGVRLIAVVSKLEPGVAVELEYRRDSDNRKTRITPIADRTFTVYTSRDSGRGGAFAMAMPPTGNLSTTWRALPDSSTFSFRMAPPALAEIQALRESPVFTTAWGSDLFGPLARLELAPINAKLGAYFGATAGVLVINVPSEDNLGLEPGDVITAVDGRAVDSPATFHRILRSYDSDDSFSLRITRQKQTQTLTAKLP